MFHKGRLMSVALGAAGLAMLATTGLATTGTALAADGTITLGAAVSLTGKYSTSGKHTKNGYDLAVERINERGGVKVGDKTYNFEIIYYDDESTPARGAQLAERLIQQDGVKYLLGPYSSGLTKAIAPVTEKHGVPMVEGNGASRSLFTNGYKYLFAVLSTTEQYLKSAVELAAEMAERDGRKPSDVTIAGAFENDPFSQDIRAGVLEDAERFGMKMVIDDKLPPDLNDMAATLTKVKALKPDLLVVSGHAKGAALGVRQVADMQAYVPMFAMTHCESAKVTEQFGADSNYVLCAAQWAPSLTYEDELFGTASNYAKDFEAKYGYVPPYQSAESTAAVMVFKDAFERAGTLDPKALRDAIAATEMQTFYGNIKFDETGKNIAKPMVLRQIQDQKYVVVAPTKWADGKITHPIPPWSERK